MSTSATLSAFENHEAWSEWRRTSPRPHEVNDLVLTRRALKDFNFHDVRFRNVTLDLVRFERCSFDRAWMRAVTSHSGYFEACNFNSTAIHDSVFATPFLNTSFVASTLTRASFHGSNLSGCRFMWSDLTDCDLSECQIYDVTFNDSTIRRVDFSYATLSSMVLARTVFEDVTGLETTFHSSPHSIGIDTFLMSPAIPASFLRMAGVPEAFIDMASELRNKVVDLSSCFISYSNADIQFARRLYADLQAHGVRTWFAPEDLKVGAEIRAEIERSIHSHDRLLLILSAQSLASSWVANEVAATLERERREHRAILFPIRIDDSVETTSVAWATQIRDSRNIGDFREWRHHSAYWDAFRRLLGALRPEFSQQSA